MKINAKIAALTGAALVFGATSVFAQSTETTTTTTTTVMLQKQQSLKMLTVTAM